MLVKSSILSPRGKEKASKHQHSKFSRMLMFPSAFTRFEDISSSMPKDLKSNEHHCSHYHPGGRPETSPWHSTNDHNWDSWDWNH